MKKLMITAATVALVAGAFADPLVYDYKASVTHMYVKLVNVRQQVNFNYNAGATPVRSGTVQVYQKYKKTASLTGYLVCDTDGATSPFLTAAQANASSAQVYDHGRNRAFLVVKNTSANAEAGVDVIRPKILPAVLDAKWFDTKFTHDANGNARLSAGIAEGTLFVGGQLVNSAYQASTNPRNGLMSAYAAITAARPKLDTAVPFLFGAVPAYLTPNMYSDYLWTSCYLFGQYNGPQWSGKYRGSETSINLAQPVFFRLPAAHFTAAESSVYHDSWMNHAGIGTSELTSDVTGPICCGLSVGITQAGTVILNSLSGNMKGGIYICSDNGYIQATGVYEPFLGTYWEDQFLAPAMRSLTALFNQNINGNTDTVGRTVGNAWENFTADVWVDGDVEQNTTDVAYGTWSIVRTTAFDRTATADRITDAEKLTWQERNRLLHATYAAGASAAASWNENGAAGNQNAPAICSNANLERLNDTIKAAAVRVNANKAGFIYVDGTEIYNMTVAGRFTLPVITPLFARAYGLAGYGL